MIASGWRGAVSTTYSQTASGPTGIWFCSTRFVSVQLGSTGTSDATTGNVSSKLPVLRGA